MWVSYRKRTSQPSLWYENLESFITNKIYFFMDGIIPKIKVSFFMENLENKVWKWVYTLTNLLICFVHLQPFPRMETLTFKPHKYIILTPISKFKSDNFFSSLTFWTIISNYSVIMVTQRVIWYAFIESEY